MEYGSNPFNHYAEPPTETIPKCDDEDCGICTDKEELPVPLKATFPNVIREIYRDDTILKLQSNIRDLWAAVITQYVLIAGLLTIVGIIIFR